MFLSPYFPLKNSRNNISERFLKFLSRFFWAEINRSTLMTSRRKLEEEIARTKDPIVRKQRQDLLDKREQRRDKTIKDAKEIGASLLCEIEKAEPAISQAAAILWIGVAVAFIFALLLFVIEWLSY
jgi:hypothetical protein